MECGSDTNYNSLVKVSSEFCKNCCKIWVSEVLFSTGGETSQLHPNVELLIEALTSRQGTRFVHLKTNRYYDVGQRYRIMLPIEPKYCIKMTPSEER